MPKSTSSKLWKNLTCAVVTIGTVSISETRALAQIVPDNTLGTESATVNSGTNIGGVESTLIDGGAIRDTNLFHSFQEFSVGEGKGAYFTNPLGVESIFSRVTGGNASQILGKLGVLGNASLFLINPNGIVFGSTATLDTKGSFIGSTASSINFADGVQFTAAPSNTTPLLTVSVPVELQFGLEPKSIQVEGNGKIISEVKDLADEDFGLQVQPNQTLALVGGDISLLGGTIKSAGGQVALGSVDSYSLVNLIPSTKGWDLDYSTVNNFRDILLANTALINVSGEGSGNAQLNSRSLTLQDGSQIEASTLGSISGGVVDINATDSVILIGGSGDPNNSSSLIAAVYPGATGNGSNIIIETKQLNLLDGAQIITGTFSTGSAGSLVIKATDSVRLAGVLPASNFVNSGLFTSVNPEATGNGGNLTVETKQLTLQDGAQIFTGTLGAGSAGNLRVVATDSINLSGTSPLVNRFGSALAASVSPGATGDGGDLTIETKQLTVADGAIVSSSTFGDGKAGNLRVVTTDSIKLSGTSTDGRFPSRLTTRTNGSNDAGDLTIESRQLSINDGATVTASSTGTGNAGSLNIKVRSVQLTNLASIVTESNSAQGGDIDLKSQNLSLQGNSRISTTAGIAGTSGNGGDITINTDTLVALEDSDITANAFEGRGGNIQITTQGLFLSPDSDITASSQFGIDGNVNIQTFGLDIKNSIIPLQNRLVTTEEVIAGSCLARRNVERGSFVITGTGGLPINPYSGINRWDNLTGIQPVEDEKAQSQESSLPLVNNNTSEGLPRKWQPGDPIVEAQALILKADGRASLIASSPQPEISNADSLVCHADQAKIVR